MIHETDTKQLFDTIATKYDFTNTIISAGINILWRRTLIKTILDESSPKKFLDLCSGTGIVTKELIRTMRHKKIPLPSIDLVDFSPVMLAQARSSLDQQNIHPRYIQADITTLPLPDMSYDVATIAYGFRNIDDKIKTVQEVARVLQPNGMLFILELTPPSSPIIRFFHSLYMSTLVPLIGGLITHHIGPYLYLNRSIQSFSVSELVKTLQNNGFSCHQPISLCFGMATLITAKKT